MQLMEKSTMKDIAILQVDLGRIEIHINIKDFSSVNKLNCSNYKNQQVFLASETYRPSSYI